MNFSEPRYYRVRFGGPGAQGFPSGGWSAVTMILVVCVILFVLGVARTELGIRLALVPKLFWRGYLWQPLTYQFLHAGFLHLAFNSLVLWSFGPELEHRWGRAKFLRFFLICGVGGGIASAIGYLGSQYPVVGMSGSIFGLLAAHAALDPNRIVLLFFFPVRIRDLVVYALAIGILSELFGSRGGIANWAHVGGAVTGYLYLKKDDLFQQSRNWYYRKKLERRRRREELTEGSEDRAPAADEREIN